MQQISGLPPSRNSASNILFYFDWRLRDCDCNKNKIKNDSTPPPRPKSILLITPTHKFISAALIHW